MLLFGYWIRFLAVLPPPPPPPEPQYIDIGTYLIGLDQKAKTIYNIPILLYHWTNM